MKEYLRPDEVAQLLNISKRKVYRLANSVENPLPSRMIGGELRISQKDLDRYIKKCRKKTYL